MIKRIMTYLFVFALFGAPAQLMAQSTTNEIESLGIEIWPDYDQTAVLVLLTGFLAADTTLPATLTIPLPENADINAVAHITTDNTLTDQGIEYTVENNELTFTSPSAGFRIEFYIPYQADGLNRDFSYTWQSNDTAVNDFRVLVQKPLAATTLSTVPISSPDSIGNNDGLTYYTLPSQNLAIGEPFTVDVSYSMSADNLTTELLGSGSNTAVENQQTPITATPIESTSAVNWPLLLGGLGLLLILIAGVWQVATRRATTHRPVKPKKRQAAPPTKAKFCHQCGTKLNANDKFCRDCGTAVKQ